MHHSNTLVMSTTSMTQFNTKHHIQMFIAACKKGDLRFIQHLINKSVDIQSLFVDTYIGQEAIMLGFNEACQYGHIDVVKYLADEQSVSKIIHIGDYECFCIACIMGHLEVVKYLVSIRADIHAQHDLGFRGACRYGHIDVVKYLVNVGEFITNYKYAFNKGFVDACEKGHLDLVIYLVSIGRGFISVNDGIIEAHKYHQYHVWKYLSSIYRENDSSIVKGLPYTMRAQLYWRGIITIYDAVFG